RVDVLSSPDYGYLVPQTMIGGWHERAVPAEWAVECIHPGARVFVGSACATPRTLLRALEDRAPLSAGAQLVPCSLGWPRQHSLRRHRFSRRRGQRREGRSAVRVERCAADSWSTVSGLAATLPIAAWHTLATLSGPERASSLAWTWGLALVLRTVGR